MEYKLLPLPYAYDALEPYIDTLTMEIHYTKHYQGYINNLNKALSKHPDLQDKSLEILLANLNQVPETIRSAIRNNGGGTYNHALFWTIMKKDGGGEPKGMLAESIKKYFGSFAEFQDTFNTAAKTVFGSGWAWLCINKEGDLLIKALPNQDSPFSQGLYPVMGLDVWEHAYYLLYQNRRPDYINAWWHVINWDQVEENYLIFAE